MLTLILDILKNYAPAVLKPEPAELNADPTVRRVVAVRDGYKLVDVAGGKAERPARRHVFADVSSFADFIRKHYPDGLGVEILADTERINAIDFASWERDEIACVLTKHPDLVAWESAFKSHHPQKGAVRFLQKMAHTLVSTEALLGTIQNFDVSGTTERTCKVNDNGVIEVKGQRTTTQMNVKLPASFTVRTPIYLDGPAVDIVVGLGLDLDSADPVFAFVPRNLEIVKLDAYRAEVANLRGLLGADYLVGAGKLSLEA